ncbi:phosphopantetheine-binding protein [Bacillus wiedmannii]|uniref:phosphopantetheine-binding protein n=1 Tax=Bacillus wiedmannii TaxID=1890302 RepID=UPI000BEF6BF0|nr:phosphopantetheine-binding protein [Bacillus wiedmannii]PEM24413.1 acyl carrier protein [Bacillus wiedmannii]
MDKTFLEIVNKYIQEDLNTNNQDKNFKELGLDSLSSIELLLEIEEAFEIVFPDELLTEDTFSNSYNLWSIVTELKGK